MSTAARIEELRKKFDENPRRYFAPLANELRKAGELTQAIALCREHLPKQPGHMSGYIVFGQALFEVGDLDQARTVFEQALALDPENLIALHHLGHIARQQGDTAAARRWYERALETDPRNDDIAHQLAALATPVRPQAAVPTPASPAAIEPERELAFLDAGLITPRRDLGAIPTPPVAQEAIDAIPLAPTPDAAMRAVDFDMVNASLSTAHEEPVAPAVPEPIDLTLDEPIAEAVAENAAGDAAASPSAQAMADDPFVFVDDELETTALGESAGAAPIDLDAAFEEGLVTAGWPDPSELAAVATPRAVTPLNVEVTPDAVEAFGREAGDPVAAPLPEPEVEVLGDDADLAMQTPAFAAEAVPDVESEDESEAELPWLATPVTPSEDVTAIVQAMEEDARALGEPDDVSMFAMPAQPTEEEAVAVAATEETSFSGVHPAIEDTSFDDAADEATDEFGHALLPQQVSDDQASQSPAFVTETMGELLVAQGFTDRAVVVYEELVRRRPYDPVLSARLAELRDQLETAAPAPVYTARERYAALAARRVVRRTPVRPYTPVSATPVGTPVVVSSVRTATPAITPAFASVPTPRTITPLVTAATTSEESLASLFGAEAQGQDDYAAQALADAFAPLPLDAAPEESFSSAFLGGADASRAPTPAYGAVRQPTPVIVPPVTPVAGEVGQEFSFDRFFPDPAAPTSSAGGAAQTAPDTPSTTGDGSPGEDLAQFSAWLKGLGQS